MIRSFAVDQVEVAVVVGGGHVAGVQPAVGIEHRGGGLGVVVVAGEHVVAPHPDLADVTDERVAVPLTRRISTPGSARPTEPKRGGTPVEVVTIGDASVRP